MEEKSPWGAARGAGASGTRNVLYVLGSPVFQGAFRGDLSS